MTAIMLTRIDNSRNMARFYKLDIQPTLFGGCSLCENGGALGVPAQSELKPIRPEAKPT